MIRDNSAHQFRKKPVKIWARRFLSNNEPADLNLNILCIWINQGNPSTHECHAWHNGTNLFIETLEGVMTANVGDYIIQGVKGEFYACKPDIFEETYERV